MTFRVGLFPQQEGDLKKRLLMGKYGPMITQKASTFK